MLTSSMNGLCLLLLQPQISFLYDSSGYYSQAKKTVNTENISGMFIVF